MLCPFCLKEGTIKKIEENGRYIYICTEHPEPKIPTAYAQNQKIPRDVISAVGFRGHGKSAYFASLFSILEDLALVWPGFFSSAIDEKSLDWVNDNVKRLKGGVLPSATPMNFPIPTIVQFSDMPQFKDRFLIFYDTGGENYERASKLINNANFVTRSQTAIFFMSLEDLQYDPQKMHQLLQTYIIGLQDLGGDPKQQHLLVVLTKGDLLRPKLESQSEIWQYLVKGNVKKLKNFDFSDRISEMKKISRLLKTFLIKEVRAAQFVNFGNASFKSMDVCIISALGSAPKGDQLEISAEPKRIFDPILWVMYNSSGRGDIFYAIKKFFISSKSAPPTKKIATPDVTTNTTGNRGLFYFIVATILLFVTGSYLSGLMLPHSTDMQKAIPTSNANPPPLVNQTDVASIQKGVSLLNSGSYQDALNEFDLALVTNPQSATIWNYKGFALFKLGKYNESILASDRAIAIEGDNIAAWNNKGQSLNLLGKYDEAIRAFDHVLSIDPNNSDSWMGKGTTLFFNKSYPVAIVAFDKVITLDPKNRLAFTYKGECLQALMRYDDAILSYDKALELKPDDVSLLQSKGECLNAVGKFNDAALVFDKILTMNQKNKEALFGKGKALLNQGRNQEALQLFNDAIKIDPTYVDAYVGKSQVSIKIKSYSDALQLANKALEIDPKASSAWISKGDALLISSKYTDANYAFDQALKFDPNSIDALVGKANVLIKMENYNDAIVTLDSALAITPSNKELLNEKGYALYKKGESANAVNILNKAIDIDQNYSAAWNNKGYALSGLGSLNLSLQAFDRAIALNPNFKDAWIGKSVVYSKMGDFKASEIAAQQAMAIKE